MAVLWEWERDVMAKRPMPDGMDIAEQAAFQAIASLYARLNAGEIKREQAVVEKKMIFKAYQEAVRMLKESAHWLKFKAAQTVKTEKYRREYRKARAANDSEVALFAADELIKALDNVEVTGKGLSEKVRR